jgi:cardiolipin synthase
VEYITHPLVVTTLAHMLVVFAVGIRVVMRRAAPGVAFAWLFLVVMLPVAGALLYVLIGERRIGPERTHRIDSLLDSIGELHADDRWATLTQVDWSRHPSAAAGLHRLCCNVIGCPTVGGSDVALFSDAEEVLQAIARDIDSATTSVSMAFYIWNEGASADTVLEALIRAANRGISCRILVDALGARPWLRGKQPQRLRAAGVQVQPALPVGLLRSFVGRTDLRLHRKIVVIDDRLAWTGSMNLVDPRIFKQNTGVGEWVDAMVRLQGSVVAPLGSVVLGDWMVETGTPFKELAESAGLHRVAPLGTADIQVIPSGPGESGDGLLQMMLALINAARKELLLTTPYLVPDDSILRALRGAAGRGVKVTIIVPERVDSILTRYASRSYFDDLLEVGIDIVLYKKGLLHTKSMVVDASMSMFGTANFDMRSLWLNYEVSLFIYDSDFANRLRALQRSYIVDSRAIDAAEWAQRSNAHRLLENSLRLVSPLL